MIIVTGAAGFIGSCLIKALNNKGFTEIVIVDDFEQEQKKHNYSSKSFAQQIDRMSLIPWLKDNHSKVSFVFHLGARTDTTLFDTDIFDKLNLNFSKAVWACCAFHGIPLLYASSAATYGDGSHGYNDDTELLDFLKPLNPYGDSKHEFDKWALSQTDKPPYWVGLKFFNVFGPNEYHKGRMASVVFHAFNQIKERGALKLFKSHRSDYEDGMQKRDFIYVKDVVDVCLFFHSQQAASGIYNLGTGCAHSFLDLGEACFEALNMTPKISFIDIPEDIRNTYQYFTEAPMKKLRSNGYQKPFTPLNKAIKDYVRNYLETGSYF